MNQRDTLLIVDDQEINRAILRSMFEEEFNILEAENGERALLLLQQYQRQIAVVLLDLVMPEKDGYAVMEEMGRGTSFHKSQSLSSPQTTAPKVKYTPLIWEHRILL